MSSDFRTKGKCPVCSEILDGATNVTDDTSPQKGDVSICVYCGSVLVFNEDQTLRIATDEELKSMPADRMDMIKTIQVAAALTGRELRQRRQERHSQN